MYRILLFCMNTNIIVSFASFSLYKVTEIEFNFQDSNLGLFVFFSTLLAYNYMRLPLFNDCNKVDLMLQETYGNKNTIYYICIFLAMIICYLISELGFKFFKLITPAIIVSLLYPISLNLSSKEYSIRKIPFFKIFLIAFIWSYITLFVPLLYYNFDINYIF